MHLIWIIPPPPFICLAAVIKLESSLKVAEQTFGHRSTKNTANTRTLNVENYKLPVSPLEHARLDMPL